MRNCDTCCFSVRQRWSEARALTRLFPRCRLKYIEDELAKRRGAAGGPPAGDEPAAAPGALTAASLYETPEDLRAATAPPGAEGDEDGADRWLTGIVEVQLPVEFKLRNIEETERAKAALLEAQRARAAAAARGERSAAPGAGALAVGGEFARACPEARASCKATKHRGVDARRALVRAARAQASWRRIPCCRSSPARPWVARCVAAGSLESAELFAFL